MSQRLHLMNWIMLRDISIRGKSKQIGLASESMSQRGRKTVKLYDTSERIPRRL